MTDAEKAAQEILEWLEAHGYIADDCYTEDLNAQVATMRIRQIIDHHMC
jgi:hypothetical protein